MPASVIPVQSLVATAVAGRIAQRVAAYAIWIVAASFVRTVWKGNGRRLDYGIRRNQFLAVPLLLLLYSMGSDKTSFLPLPTATAPIVQYS